MFDTAALFICDDIYESNCLNSSLQTSFKPWKIYRLHIRGQCVHACSLHSKPGLPNLFTISYHLGTSYGQRVPLLPEQL